MSCLIRHLRQQVFFRWFPDYYEDIANPISLTQIKRKIKKKKYRSLNEMAADLNLMFENAKEYNADESKIFQVSVLISHASMLLEDIFPCAISSKQK